MADENYFLKSTVKSDKIAADGKLKAELNRKGNQLMNAGKVEDARRIFVTTGYSDGLIRVGDYYRKAGRSVDALRMYWAGHDKKKADTIIVEIALLLKSMIENE
jgi:hypothetical protein